FGHDFNGIIIARSDLDAVNPNADPAMAKLARQLLDQGPATHSEMGVRVRGLVVSLLGAGPCTIELAAQHLGVDRRTVHRQLAREGQTFSEILDSVRSELAVRYLRDKRRPLSEVSALLGFSAPSGFTRWYRNHFGMAPSQARNGSGR